MASEEDVEVARMSSASAEDPCGGGSNGDGPSTGRVRLRRPGRTRCFDVVHLPIRPAAGRTLFNALFAEAPPRPARSAEHTSIHVALAAAFRGERATMRAAIARRLGDVVTTAPLRVGIPGLVVSREAIRLHVGGGASR
jgi:hypothetical protein